MYSIRKDAYNEFCIYCGVYGEGLILCQLLPGKEYTGSDNKTKGFDSKLVAPDASGKTSNRVEPNWETDSLLELNTLLYFRCVNVVRIS